MEIKQAIQGIKDLVKADWSGEPPEFKELKLDYLPELLYILLVIGILFFGLSFLSI